MNTISKYVAALLTVAAMSGCASTRNNPVDPFEGFNRAVFNFNDGLDRVALKPAATVYQKVLPSFVQTGIGNFFGNLADVWTSVNNMLQGKIEDGLNDMMRVAVNSTLGFGGLLDIGSEAGLQKHKEDFGQTLGRWGVPAGPYLVLPLLGPSTVRDTVALGLDFNVDPVHWVDPWQPRYALYLLRAVDVRSNLLRAGAVLDEAALDKYTFFRDAHLQRRRANIFEDNKSKDDDKAGREPKADGEPSPDAGKLPPEPPDEVAPAVPPTGK